MKTETFDLWTKTPGMCEEIPKVTVYIPENKKCACAVVVIPGGGYTGRANHEGEGYAEFLSANGITAFVCNYRVSPHRFPLPLLDARRTVRFARYNAKKYGIDKNKIAVMGSSAGGHLAALTSTYFENIDFEGADEIDNEDFIPNAQILSYPVIKLSVDNNIAHVGSCVNLLGTEQLDKAHRLTPEYIISEKTPPCFIWHTMEDGVVPVSNSIEYAAALNKNNISCEMHIFPDGHHGMGIPKGEGKLERHITTWSEMLLNWLSYIDFCN